MSNHKSMIKRAALLISLIAFAVSVAGCWPFYQYDERITAIDKSAAPQLVDETTV